LRKNGASFKEERFRCGGSKVLCVRYESKIDYDEGHQGPVSQWLGVNGAPTVGSDLGGVVERDPVTESEWQRKAKRFIPRSSKGFP